MRQQEEKEEEYSQAVGEGKSRGGRKRGKSKPGQGEAKVAV